MIQFYGAQFYHCTSFQPMNPNEAFYYPFYESEICNFDMLMIFTDVYSMLRLMIFFLLINSGCFNMMSTSVNAYTYVRLRARPDISFANMFGLKSNDVTTICLNALEKHLLTISFLDIFLCVQILFFDGQESRINHTYIGCLKLVAGISWSIKVMCYNHSCYNHTFLHGKNAKNYNDEYNSLSSNPFWSFLFHNSVNCSMFCEKLRKIWFKSMI